MIIKVENIFFETDKIIKAVHEKSKNEELITIYCVDEFKISFEGTAATYVASILDALAFLSVKETQSKLPTKEGENY